jgi:hypothetical protein
MAIALGGSVVHKLALGSTELLKAYHGSALIHDKTGAPPEADIILQENGDALLLETSAPLERDTGIPGQSIAATLDGNEWAVIVQDGTTKKIRAARIAEYIDV